MIFAETRVQGAYILDIERRADDRGYFARVWCQKEFEAHGLDARLVQANVAVSKRKGTLRGVHFQLAPHEEVKVTRCTRGAVYDVVVDLRPDSPTYLQWAAAELTADNHRMLYAPAGCAHGFQTLTDDAELWYQTSQFYAPKHVSGIRYDDPAFGIEWPLAVTALSDADRSWPDYERHGCVLTTQRR
jgi:dTDP-4-dehydrorhamnose 3,5-epimerase